MNWWKSRSAHKPALPSAPDVPAAVPPGAPAAVLENFLALLRARPAPRVLELGTRRSNPDRCTLHRDWAPHAAEFVGTDFEDGLDVDVVADVHALSGALGENRFDAIISCSTFEHIQYPWIAAVELARVLAPGGLLFVQTHQSFPLHAYPHDYWRFTTDALRTLFGAQAGFETLGTEYVFRCRIANDRDPHIEPLPSYLNVHALARKVSHPPADLRWRALP